MAMPDTVRRWTKNLVQSLPNDGKRYELVSGELLVTPAPAAWHEIVHRRLTFAIGSYLQPLGLIETLFFTAADISWTDDDLVQPDLFVVAPEDLSLDWTTYKHLRLVIEVLSPSSRRGDRVLKRRLYQQHGVETYWIVDPDRHTVEVWHPGNAAGTAVADTLTWRVTPEAPELRVALAEVFRPLA
ncbi:MAG: Uma2 family endonuclease [Gemmatimonadota bacterium]